MEIGTPVQVVGDCNDELMGKRGVVVGVVAFDEGYILGGIGKDTDAEDFFDGDQDPNEAAGEGWRWALPRTTL